jgi:hypothetical protein
MSIKIINILKKLLTFLDLAEVSAILAELPADFRFRHEPAFQSTPECLNSVSREYQFSNSALF